MAYGLIALMIAAVSAGVFYARFYSQKAVERRRRNKERERRKVRGDQEV